MKILVALKFRLFGALALVLVVSGFSQEKFVESYNAGDDMVVRLKTSYTNVIFETWNKDKVEVTALIQGDDVTKEQKQALFDTWDFEVLGNSKNVHITSSAIGNWNGNSLSSIEAQIAKEFDTDIQRSQELGKVIERSVKIANGISYSKTTLIDKDGAVKTIVKTNKAKTMPLVKRTIIIKMPKNTKTDINVRYGEIKMADAFNVKATLNHTPFTADRIDGVQTLINASYAPVIVKHWQYGTLYVKFVDTCEIQTLESIQLNANSSDVFVGSISKEAYVTGSFGTLIVGKVADNFTRLEIVLRNTDASVAMPDTPFTFLFNGKKSSLKHPKSLQFSTTKEAQRVLAKGFYKNASTTSNFLVNADYSNLILQ
jgi:hypothetical protein